MTSPVQQVVMANIKNPSMGEVNESYRNTRRIRRHIGEFPFRHLIALTAHKVAAPPQPDRVFPLGRTAEVIIDALVDSQELTKPGRRPS